MTEPIVIITIVAGATALIAAACCALGKRRAGTSCFDKAFPVDDSVKAPRNSLGQARPL